MRPWRHGRASPIEETDRRTDSSRRILDFSRSVNSAVLIMVAAGVQSFTYAQAPPLWSRGSRVVCFTTLKWYSRVGAVHRVPRERPRNPRSMRQRDVAFSSNGSFVSSPLPPFAHLTAERGLTITLARIVCACPSPPIRATVCVSDSTSAFSCCRAVSTWAARRRSS